METFSIRAHIEGAVARQAALTGGDPAIESVVEVLLDVLEPTLREVALDLAQQAAAEVASQLPDYEVDVVVEDGEPTLRVRQAATDLGDVDYAARLTLRLPDMVKERIEEAAGSAGDSVNAWVVKALSSKVRQRRGRRFQGTVQL